MVGALRGLIIAAPASGVGKTTVTLGLISALVKAGQKVRPFKIGPDYIDPTFLSAAAGTSCANLDPWAMDDETLAAVLGTIKDGEIAIVEGVMGLHDGPGSTAAVARKTGWPILLVIDAGKSAQTAAAVAQGLQLRDPDLSFAGFVFNRVTSKRHEKMIRDGLKEAADGGELKGAPPVWVLPPESNLHLPSRHLGLHQAHEQQDLQQFLAVAAQWAAPLLPALGKAGPSRLSGQNIDRVNLTKTWPEFGLTFAYPHIWVPKGSIFLPGGYPELYLEKICTDPNFLPNLREAAAAQVPIYGECGGFMVLGEAIIDPNGKRHEMAGLLPLVTSFAQPKRHLGYREMRVLTDFAWGKAGETWRGHEFHYTQITWHGDAQPLFHARDAYGTDLGPQGLKIGSVAGSYLHLISKVN